jgi:RND superfamily putative drug exporter
MSEPRAIRPDGARRSNSRTIATMVVRRRRLVLVAASVVAVVALVLGAGAGAKLQPGGFSDAGSPSQLAADRLSAAGLGEPNLVLLVTPRRGSVTSPVVVAFGRRLAGELEATPGVRDVRSYWTTPSAALESRSGREGLVVAVINGSDGHVASVANAVIGHDATRPQGTAASDIATVRAGGAAGVNYDTSGQVGKDLARAELIAIPLTLLLLVVVFGSVVAGLLPILIGLLAIVASLATLDVIASFTDVSIYAEQLVTALGLGLAIDYSLLIVNRFREHLASGLETSDAVVATVVTAGRTVLFSACIVAASLSTLLVFPLTFLRSMAYAGIPVVLAAAVGATVVLPALIAGLGQKVNAGHLRFLGALDGGESRFWLRSTRTVLRRPLVAGGAVLVLLLVAASPLLHVHFGIPDDRVLPASAPSHQVGDVLRSEFPLDSANTVAVVTDAPLRPSDSSNYAARLSRVEGVTVVDAPTGVYASGRRVGSATLAQPAGSTWFSVVSTADPESPGAAAQVAAVRSVPVPGHGSADVGGAAASLVDLKHGIGSRLPIALALIALITFAVLFAYTGSVLLPLKAIVLNLLSISAVIGIAVWIFQQGHLSGLLGFTPGPLAIAMPVLLAVVAFGLSMDYEVFVLSRIKELHDAGYSDDDAVSHGLARSGRIISTAAALLSVTFFAFGTSHLSFLQLFGIGTAIAILIDATLVRGVLVPAVIGLAGPFNWWAPASLRRLHGRLGVSEAETQPHVDL